MNDKVEREEHSKMNKLWKWVVVLGVGASSWIGSASAAEQSEWRVGTGVDYSSGSYGETEDTDIVYVPVMIRYMRFPWTAKLTVPYLQIEGPGGVVGGVDGPVQTGQESGSTTRESGLGDVVAALVYSLDPWSANAPALDFTAKAKLPTADEGKDLGTGEADYSLQLDVSQRLGAWSPFATAGYQFMGSSDELKLDDRFYGSLGLSRALPGKSSAGVSYDFRKAASSTSEDSHEVGLFGAWRMAPEWRMSAYTAAGLSDGAPDFNVGVQVHRTLY